MKTPIIESKRLILRRFKASDAEGLIGLEKSDRILGKVNNIQRAKKWIAGSVSDDGYYLAVILKENGRLIGDVELCHMKWWDYKAGEICYAIHKDHRGKGYASEASAALINHCFRKMKLMKMYADTDPDNKISQKVLKKLGFKLEGRIREKHLVNGKWIDELDYGLLRKEWKGKGF